MTQQRTRRWMLVASIATVLSVTVGVVTALYLVSDTPQQDCTQLSIGMAARQCYESQILENVDTGDVDAVLRAAAALLARPESAGAQHFARECHEVTHNIGRLFEETYGNIDVSNVPFSTCVGGLAHGVYEYRMEQMTYRDIVAAAPGWCGDDPAWGCRHLVGHVAMVRALASGPVTDALGTVEEVCAYPDAAGEDRAYEEFYCIDGAYMQWMLDTLRVDAAYATADPLSVCASLLEQNVLAAQGCYRQVAPIIYEQVATHDDVIDVCNEIAAAHGTIMGVHCVRSVAANLVSLSDRPVADAAALCPGSFDALRCLAEFDRLYSDTVGTQEGFGMICRTLPDLEQEQACRTQAGQRLELVLPPGISAAAPAAAATTDT